MSKLKDFLNLKLANFKVFIDQQFEILKTKGMEIEESKINNIRKDLLEFENNLSQFVQQMNYLEGREIDDCVKLFLLKYEIDINQIKQFIDYEKLKKYIEMFLEVIKQ